MMSYRASFCLLICLNLTPAFGNELEYCRAHLKTMLARFIQPGGLTLVPGKEILYSSGYLDGQTHLESVNLTLKPGDDIEGIARILAQGKPHETIQNKLSGATTVPLVQVVPEFPAARTGTRPTHADPRMPDGLRGPNCWNATLNWHDASIGARFTSDLEVEEYLRSRYRQLMPGEELKFGDVVGVYDETGIEHTAIYIDDNLIWHKPTFETSTPWTFATMDGMLIPYVRQSDKVRLRFFRYTR